MGEVNIRDSIAPINCARDTTSIYEDFTKSQVKITFKDDSMSILNIINLHENSLRKSSRLKKDKPEIVNGKYTYNLFMNFCNSCQINPLEPKLFLDRIFYMQEKVNTLFNNILNYVNEFILSTVDNKVYHFKDMLNKMIKQNLLKQWWKKLSFIKEEITGNYVNVQIYQVGWQLLYQHRF